jgi:hypothetical protein
MAGRGPVPKRSEERRRADSPDAIPLKTAPVGDIPEIPPAQDYWHPLATGWYESLAASGQSAFYEPSDWSTAYILAESMHRLLTYEKFSATLLQTILSGMADLLTTEGTRRRARVELIRASEEVEAKDTKVVAMSAYRQAAS